MTTKVKVIICVAALGTAFVIGRWSLPAKVVIQTKTVEVEKKSTQANTDQAKHQDVTTVTVKNKDGSETITTHAVTDTNTDKSVSTKLVDNTTTQTSKETTYSTSKITILALAATDITNPTKLTYGISLSRPVLGPLSVGIFGFTSGTFGVGAGLTF